MVEPSETAWVFPQSNYNFCNFLLIINGGFTFYFTLCKPTVACYRGSDV